jgi:hypothetical protein
MTTRKKTVASLEPSAVPVTYDRPFVVLGEPRELYQLAVGGDRTAGVLFLGINIGTREEPSLTTAIDPMPLLAMIAKTLDVTFDPPIKSAAPLSEKNGQIRLAALIDGNQDVMADTYIQGPGITWKNGNPVIIPSNDAASLSFGLVHESGQANTYMSVRALDFLNIVRDTFGITFVDAGGLLTRHMQVADAPFEVLPNRKFRDLEEGPLSLEAILE